ncbi:MAG: M20/M25/M40 family metallo-hydrolase [Gemmataceae bacterium]|nr:M20/M25/M40 family metallo-hydrolase [Gemmataceae bacterium]
MHRFRSASYHPAAVWPSPRLWGWLGAFVLGVAGLTVSFTWAQQATPAPQAPAVAVAKAPAAPAAEALALDQQILAEAKKSSEIMANLTYLSDIIGPRLTGSPALKRANEWTAEKMRSYGLTNVRLEGWTIPVGWERGTATARLVEPNNGRTLTIAAMGWSGNTKGKLEGDVVFINARNAKELEPYKGKLKNAVVLRSPPRPIPADTGFPSGRRGQGGEQRRGQRGGVQPPGQPAQPGQQAQPGQPGQRGARGGRPFGAEMTAFQRELQEFLRNEGVAAIVGDAGKPHGLLTVSGSWRGRERADAAEPIPSLVMAHEHYSLLHRLATRPAPARTRVEIEVQNKLIPGPIAVYNTIGEIPGKEKPDEFVVIGAHLDSWDLAQGTTDNGTGSCIVLEAARLLARSGVQPRRTIRFVLFSGEEQGLHGSRAYTQQHKDEMPKTSVALVHDTGTGRVVGLGLQGREVLKPILEAEIGSLKEIGVTDVNLRSMNGSDHMSFEQAGVPGLMLQQDMSGYTFTHHSQSDTLDKAREPDLIQGAQAMAVIAIRVANMPLLLPRDKPARR